MISCILGVRSAAVFVRDECISVPTCETHFSSPCCATAVIPTHDFLVLRTKRVPIVPRQEQYLSARVGGKGLAAEAVAASDGEGNGYSTEANEHGDGIHGTHISSSHGGEAMVTDHAQVGLQASTCPAEF